MKTKKLNKKLTLNKITIASLSEDEKKFVKGGTETYPHTFFGDSECNTYCHTECGEE